jgi:hypothetical protein
MRRPAWIALLSLTLIALAIVAVPVYLIRPFVSQTDSAVALSHLLRRWSPVVTGLIAVLAAGLGAVLWRSGTGRHRLGVLPPVLVVIAAAWFARQRYFEWMFAPLANPQYVRAATANWVEAHDMVLAVNLNGDAVAYPVRQLAYHHLVQDSVGGVPIVATY